MAKMIFQDKVGNVWQTTFEKDGPEVWEDLAKDLLAKKLEACRYITSIKRKQNYDGTNTIIVNYASDCGGGRRVYTIKR